MNYIYRFFISILVELVALYVFIRTYVWLFFYKRRQNKYCQKYQVKKYRPEKYTQRHIDAMKKLESSHSFYMVTSSTTSVPKKILATSKRISNFHLEFIASFVTVINCRLNLKTFFSIANLFKDDTFTDFATRPTRPLSRLLMLQSPFQLLYLDCFQIHLKKYTANSIRLFLVVASSPRFLYATNPSALLLFLETINDHSNKQFIQDFVDKKLFNQSEIEKYYQWIKDSHIPFEILLQKKITIQDIVPKLKEILCWDGPYLDFYIQKLKQLIPSKVNFLSMSSMSTEVTQTVCFGKYKLPIAREVFYEFYNMERTEIFTPSQLKVGEKYIMIISNQFGLVRYDTNDLFLCTEKFWGVPSLEFIRRFDQTYDIAGEKLTEDQVILTIEKTKTYFPSVKFYNFSIAPIKNQNKYCLYLYGENLELYLQTSEIQKYFDNTLGEFNFLYKSRRESKLLDLIEIKILSTLDFISIVNPDKKYSWESQFKFLPFYIKAIELN